MISWQNDCESRFINSIENVEQLQLVIYHLECNNVAHQFIRGKPHF